MTDVSMETTISIIDCTVTTTFGHPRDIKLIIKLIIKNLELVLHTLCDI